MLLRLALIVAVAMQGLIGPVSECAEAACRGSEVVVGLQSIEAVSASACCGGGSESGAQAAGDESAFCCCCAIDPCREPASPSAPPAPSRQRSDRDQDGVAPPPFDAVVIAFLEAPHALGGATELRAPVSPPSVRARLSLLCVRTT